MSQFHEGFTLVTQDKFFAVIGPRNVNPRSERDQTFWETPDRALLGISTPGYMCEGPCTYRLVKGLVFNADHIREFPQQSKAAE